MIRLSSPEKKRGNQPLREQNTPYMLLMLISAAENFVKLLFLSVHPVLHKPFPQSLAHVPYNNKSLRVIMLHNILHADNIPA